LEESTKFGLDAVIHPGGAKTIGRALRAAFGGDSEAQVRSSTELETLIG
jgi:hypothetical protein